MSQSPRVPLLVEQTLLNQEESYMYDPGAERGFLACCMARPDLLTEAQQMVKPEMLFHDLHRYVYKVMLYVAAESPKNGWAVAFDEVTVLSVAKLKGQQYVNAFISKMDGMKKWREIGEFARYVSLEQFPRHMATVRDRAARVYMYRTARRLQVASMDMEANPVASQVACTYEASLSQIAFGSSDNQEAKMRGLGEYCPDLMFKAGLNAANPDRHLFHLRHPRFPYWMNLMGGGFRRNSLTIVAARPKVGKTTLLLNLAIDFAIAGIPVLFLDTEMSGEEMVSRELSNLADIDEHVLIAGKFLQDSNRACATKVHEAIARLQQAPFQYACIAGKPVEYGLSVMRQFRNQVVGTEQLIHEGRTLTITRPCAVFYDWLKLPTGGSNENGVKEFQLLGDLCSQLKDAAKNLNLPVIAGAQQNRGAVGKDENDHAENAEAYIANSDRLAQFCSTLCVLRNPSLKMAEEIAAKWPNARVYTDGLERAESATWKFNQIFQVILQRQGRECRTGIPFFIDRGHAKYEEVAGPEHVDVVRFLRDYSKARATVQRGKQGGLPPATSVAHAPPAPASSSPAPSMPGAGGHLVAA